MSRKILVLTNSRTSLTDAAPDVWEWYQLTLFKRDTLEEAIKDLKTDFYLAVIVALNRDNVDEVRHQTKVFQTLTASPICVVAQICFDGSGSEVSHWKPLRICGGSYERSGNPPRRNPRLFM